MSPGMITRPWLALPAALLGLLAFSAAAPAQTHKPKLGYCSPCDHPYFGYYGTCWRPFPPGWVACPCDPKAGPFGSATGPETIPSRPRPVNGGEPEPIPAPRPDLNPVSQGRLMLMRLVGGGR